MHLGSRAIEILIALVEHHGELVTKNELMARVWPDTTVVDANLSVHIAALRRALRDGQAGNRYVVNTPGRGYRFVEPVTRTEALHRAEPVAAMHGRKSNLPSTLTSLIGRDDQLDELAQYLTRGRLLTIAGPGGIGKTSVALALAEKVIGAYEDGVWFVDLAPVTDPDLVPSAIAVALGLELSPHGSVAYLINALRDKRSLLVLDNCEHVIAAVEEVATEILQGAHAVRILATSREPLRARSERVYRLAPLETPPPGVPLTAAEALRYPAVELFAERAASAGRFELCDWSATVVAEICIKLDGMPLAIEFAAGRVETFGVQGIADRLDDHLLLAGFRRMVPSRHQSMTATLDWSHRLLTETEQTLLRRLAIFESPFTLSTAAAVMSDGAGDASELLHDVTGLVLKSLVSVESGDHEPRFRLLNTTRTYAIKKLIASGEVTMMRKRLFDYTRNWTDASAQSYWSDSKRNVA